MSGAETGTQVEAGELVHVWVLGGGVAKGGLDTRSEGE